MKHLKFLFLIILPVTLLIACSGNNSKRTTENNDTSSSSSANSSVGEAHFSCVIDGQHVSGSIIDNGLQYSYQSNMAYIDEVDKGKELLFYLSDSKNADSPAVHTLRFSVPDKAGTSSFGHEEDAWGIQVSINVNKNHTAIYNSDSFTINIISLSASRVSGNFSGKFEFHGNIDDTDKNEIEVTDGKFDIPVSNR